MNQKIVPFYGDNLLATQDERGVWVALKEPCDALGLQANAQRERLLRQPWAETRVMRVTEAGRTREVFQLHQRSVPMWLATIQASRVAPEVREKLVHYQREAADVLARAFLQAFAPSDPVVAMLVEEVRDLRNQMWGFFQGSLAAHERRFEALESVLLEQDRKLKQLRRGSRVSTMGRASGRDRKVQPRAPKPLALAQAPLALPGSHP